MIWTVLVGLICFVVGFYLGMKAGVWGTVNALAEASPAKRMAVFTKWIAQRRAR